MLLEELEDEVLLLGIAVVRNGGWGLTMGGTITFRGLEDMAGVGVGGVVVVDGAVEISKTALAGF